MYNPDGPENYCEYIELLNVGDSTINLENWLISDGTAEDSLLAEPGSQPLSLSPGQYAIILDPGYWEGGEYWYDDRIPPTTLILTVPGSALGSAGLTNSSSERVSLLDAQLDTISSRLYLPDAPNGFSEERILTDGEFRDGEGDENWQFVAGGTPGYLNFSTPPQMDLALTNLILTSDSLQNNPNHGVDYSLTVSNLGVNISTQTSISIYFDRHLNQSFEYFRDHNIPPLAYLEEIIIDGRVENLLPGKYKFRFELNIQDENSTNDIITDFAYFPYPPSSLGFDEIMPSPPDTIPCEWFELLNRTDEAIPIGGWSVRDASNRWADADSIYLQIEPGARFLYAEDTTIFHWQGTNSTNTIIPQTWISLNDNGDSLFLFDPSGFPIATIVYPAAEKGRSFQRVSYSESATAGDWQRTSPLIGGTPGFPPESNSNAHSHPNLDVKVSPNPFAPGGTNNSKLQFQFTLPANDCKLELRIFDVNGAPLGLILSTTTHSKKLTWTWDGRQNLSEKLIRGIYVFHARAIAVETGRTWEKKGTIVSAGSGG
ncbi:lamin tail domain-containing protein [bacterium]|nr:lamin tail domain-containing protein [bacterium]